MLASGWRPPDKSVDGIETIPSADDRVFESDVAKGSSRDTIYLRESVRSGSESVGFDKDMDRRRVCVTTTSN